MLIDSKKTRRMKTRQWLLGGALGAVTAACVLLWLLWSKATLVAIALGLIPPALILFRYPDWGMAIVFFALTSRVGAYVPKLYSVSLLLTLFALIYVKLYRRDYTWKFPPFVGWSVLLVAWMFVSLLWSPSEPYVPLNIIWPTVAIMLIVPELVRTPRQVRFMVLTLAAGIVFTAISSVYEIYALFTNPAVLQSVTSRASLTDVRYFGHWGGSNEMAHSVMPFVALLVPFWGQSETRKWMKILIALAVLGGIIAICISLTRAAMLGLGASLAVVILASRYRWKLAIAATIAILIIVWLIPVGFGQRLTSFSKGRADSSFNQRAYVYSAGIAITEKTFPLGIGMGGFRANHDDYFRVPFRVIHAHNTYLQVLSEYGLIGAVLFALVMYSLYQSLRNPWGSRSCDTSARQIQIALVATVLGLFVGSVFENMLFSTPYWLVLVLISICPSVYAEPEPEIITKMTA